MSDLLLDPAYKGAPEFPNAKVRGGNRVVSDFEDLAYRGNWPRMIKLKEETAERLTNWLDYEIEEFFQERSELNEQWKNWQTLYWAEPEEKERNFPFRRASNIVIPLAAIAVEAITARLINTLFSVEPFYSIRPRSKEWIPAAKPFEKYLQSEVENGETIRMFHFCQETITELSKLGTCVAKTGYERLTKKSLRRIGNTEEDFYVTVKNGATIDRVPLSNFIMRLNETDPQTAPIVGEEHEITWSKLKQYAQDGRMDADVINKKVKTYWQTVNQPESPSDGSDLRQHVAGLADAEPAWTATFKFYEIWCLFDVDGDGWDEEIVIDYHKASKSILSIRYNWYDDLHRPYHICQYLKVEGIWPGLGVCKQVEQFQHEATTIHRQRLDNATLANMKMMALKKDSDYGPGEPLFPGKQWFLDDPSKDIKEISLSEIYPSSYANEESVLRYSDKRSGANEMILGLPHEGTPATATSDLTRLAEGNKRYDLVLKNVRRWLSGIGVDVVTNMQIFGNQQVHWLVLGEDGAWVEQVLRMPSILIRRGAIVDLTVSDSVTNKEVEQRQWMALFQTVTGYYNQVLQLVQVLGDPNLFAQIAQRALITSDEAMRRLLETFQIPDSDRFSLVEEPPPNGSNGTNTPGSSPSNPGSNGSPNRISQLPLGNGSPGTNGSSIQTRVGNLP